MFLHAVQYKLKLPLSFMLLLFFIFWNNKFVR